MLLGVTAAFGYVVVGFAAKPGPGGGKANAFVLREVDDLAAVSERLFRAGLLAQPRMFNLYLHLLGASNRLRQGTVMLRDNMTPRQLLQRIATGYGSTVIRVTIPEGFDRFDISQRLAQWDIVDGRAFLAATKDAKLLSSLGISAASAEGYLFPDTYQLQDQSEPRVVLEKLVRTAQSRVHKLVSNQAAPAWLQPLNFDERDILTLASIVEKEAAAPAEQPIIAGVFINRLLDPDFSPRRLQADPTVAYGCRETPELSSCADFDGKHVLPSMLRDPSNVYNTYRHDGLPPGPICNPGLAAIRAVLSPARHHYFYFVAAGQGRHRFSETLMDHNQAIDTLRKLQ